MILNAGFFRSKDLFGDQPLRAAADPSARKFSRSRSPDVACAILITFSVTDRIGEPDTAANAIAYSFTRSAKLSSVGFDHRI